MASEATSPARSTGVWSQLKALAASPMAPFYFVVASVLILVSLGVMMVLSASSVFALATQEDPYYFAIRQVAFLVAGFVFALILMRIPPDALRKLGWPVWMLAVALLIMVLTPLGVTIYGNTNWLAIGPLQFQPSEFAKLALIVWCGAIFHVKRGRLHEPLQLAVPPRISGP